MVDRYPEIAIRKAGYVGDNRIDEAKSALETYANQIRYGFEIFTDYRDEANMNDEVDCYSVEDSVRNVEQALYDRGALDNADIHVLIHDCGSGEMGGAGRACWDAGVPDDTYYHDGTHRSRNYESVGNYALVWVNATVRHAPYNLGWYLNTVIHEVGHTFGLEHSDGGVYWNDEASPMCTWYVESNESVYVDNGDLEGDGELCVEDGDWDDSGHTTDVTESCTVHKTELPIEEYF